MPVDVPGEQCSFIRIRQFQIAPGTTLLLDTPNMTTAQRSYENFNRTNGIAWGTLGKVQLFTKQEKIEDDSREVDSGEHRTRITALRVMGDWVQLSNDQISETNPVFAAHKHGIRSLATETVTSTIKSFEEGAIPPSGNDTEKYTATSTDYNTKDSTTGFEYKERRTGSGFFSFLKDARNPFRSRDNTLQEPKVEPSLSPRTILKIGDSDTHPRITLTFDPIDQGGYPTGTCQRPDDTKMWEGRVRYFIDTKQSHSALPELKVACETAFSPVTEDADLWARLHRLGKSGVQ